MTINEFKSSIEEKSLPGGLNDLQKALWYDAKGEWDKAHEIAQGINNFSGSLIHAYLHRKEGDVSNANYWYAKADRKMPNVALSEEWDQLVEEMFPG
jgi:hypothetical protein